MLCNMVAPAKLTHTTLSCIGSWTMKYKGLMLLLLNILWPLLWIFKQFFISLPKLLSKQICANINS